MLLNSPNKDSKELQVKHSWDRRWYGSQHNSGDSYDEYLMAMKRVHHHSIVPTEMISARERHRKSKAKHKKEGEEERDTLIASRISTIASMVPDEIIIEHNNRAIRTYETALMFLDVSGFTDLCETYTKPGRGGPSKLTGVLNGYIGALVQEILTHNGDVLKFSGDAFLCMWKKTDDMSMQDVVHTAIDCGLLIQKNYGTRVTDVGVVLKVKVAIAAGLSHFSIIGDGSMSHYVIVGQPVWDVKMAEYASTAGDVLTTASTWIYVNEAEYCTQPCGDGKHTKVMGVGVTWKRVEKVRPSLISAMHSTWWKNLRSFMLSPVLRAVDNDEHMDFLTEVRHVVVVFLNIITKTVTEAVLIAVVDTVYKNVCGITSESGGLVNKVSLFDKDIMCLVVFGLRGLKQEDEACKALTCADKLKQTLTDPNILSVSIGVTSGRTYCGVVGHVLRREYTVISSSVNKAARLMTTYLNRVTCDKETFVRSKLDLDYFRLVQPKPLKGIAQPGPIYEFNMSNPTLWGDRAMYNRHPILGRNEEIRKFKVVFHNAVSRHHERFTRYRNLHFGLAVMGPHLVGKTRLVDEFLTITPSFMRLDKINLTKEDMVPYGLIRLMLMKLFMTGDPNIPRDKVEAKVRYSIGMLTLSPRQLDAMNTIFNCRFPLPENYVPPVRDLLSEPSVRSIIVEIFKSDVLKIQVIEEIQFVDDHSWRVLLLLLEAKCLFVVMTWNTDEQLSEAGSKCLKSGMIVKINLAGVDRWYHAALACQLLDVQAVPVDLEKVIESASGGLPGWIQNFVISLMQRGEMSVVTVSRSQALEASAVLPSAAFLQRVDFDADCSLASASIVGESSQHSYHSTQSKRDLLPEGDVIQMAVLSPSCNFLDMPVNMTMDVIILKTYDSLTPFEKMLLKCGSVLGDVFSRRMLLHLVQCDSPRKVALAVKKLFEIRVLECEGGDFTRDSSMVFVHSAPLLQAAKPPFCSCLGTRPHPYCKDLPPYAFCGYMKFKHSMFKTTTYELLTENQKHEMHGQALLYLERYTRRCLACGTGCFTKLLGVRCDDGLSKESKKLKRVRAQISALSAESRMVSQDSGNVFMTDKNEDVMLKQLEDQSIDSNTTGETSKLREMAAKMSRKSKRARSFASLDLDNCECLPILLAVYNQVIDHCRGVGDFNKLFEAYLEYADLSIIKSNIPQAVRLLAEVEKIVTEENNCVVELCKDSWMKEYRVARILSLRGECMIETGDLGEAKKHLLQAMKLMWVPFPSAASSVWLSDKKCSFRQLVGLYLSPRLCVATHKGFEGYFFNDIAKTLNNLTRLFYEGNELKKGKLAAKWAFNCAVRYNAVFRTLCIAYARLITVYRQEQKFALCRKLEKSALEICNRKRGQLDITEVHALSALYTSIFLFYLENGNKAESLDFGLSVIPMISNITDLMACQMLILWLLKLLLSDLRIHEMVLIMRDFFYMSDHYDTSLETWYYSHAMVILLDTGYCVETYGACEKFYIKKGNAIHNHKSPLAATCFFVVMWLVTVRVGAWERSILWEEKIKTIVTSFNVGQHGQREFSVMIMLRAVEGFLIVMVFEMNSKNLNQIDMLKKSIKTLFKQIYSTLKHTNMYLSRYYLLLAYYKYIQGKKSAGLNLLRKCLKEAKKYDVLTIKIWAEHTLKHWQGRLTLQHVNFWTEHTDDKNLLDYRDVDREHLTVIPYTLPLPNDSRQVGNDIAFIIRKVRYPLPLLRVR